MLFIILSIVAVIVDVVSKAAVVRFLKPVGSIPLIPDVFHLTYVENRGAAFGILQNQRWIFILLTIAILCLLVYIIFFKKYRNKMFMFCGALVFGGAAGNLIDRIFRGYVVDMFDFRLIHFPVFNVADICVCVGVILAAVYYLFFDKEKVIDKLFEKDKNDHGKV